MAQSFRKIQIPDIIGELFVTSRSYLGGIKTNNNIKNYIFGQRKDGVNVFDLDHTWDKLILAARACAGIKNAESIVAVSGKAFGCKPVLKFSEAIGSKNSTGRFIPGTFTNTNIKGSCEPRLIVVSDPIVDKQAIMEASMVNCPVIAFCNTDADLSYVDIAIPINNRSPAAIGVGFFLLSRLINYIKNGFKIDENIENVELFFYRDASELETLLMESNAEVALDFANSDIQPNAGEDFGQTQPSEPLNDSDNWKE